MLRLFRQFAIVLIIVTATGAAILPWALYGLLSIDQGFFKLLDLHRQALFSVCADGKSISLSTDVLNHWLIVLHAVKILAGTWHGTGRRRQRGRSVDILPIGWFLRTRLTVHRINHRAFDRTIR